MNRLNELKQVRDSCLLQCGIVGNHAYAETAELLQWAIQQIESAPPQGDYDGAIEQLRNPYSYVYLDEDDHATSIEIDTDFEHALQLAISCLQYCKGRITL